MNRREFVKSSAAASLTASLHGSAQAKRKAKKPNVLFVFSDQHRAASLPGQPFNQAAAPNLEAFRQKNFSMDRCVSNYPLCTPYRGILMSGKWPSQSGVIYNNVTLSMEEGALGETFQQNGYHTGYIGKWHLAGHGESPGFIPPGPKRLGFEDWQAWDATNLHYHSWTYNQQTGEKILPEGWQPTRMTDDAVQFIENQKGGEKPWLLVLSWNPPHPPYNPPPEELAKYPLDTLKLRPNVMTHPDEEDKQGTQQFLVSDSALRTAMQGYYGAITGVDAEFARLLRALEETGQAQDTIVVYTSDHGEMMGSHGRMQKQVPFEESARVPFLVRYPGVTPSGGRSDALFAAVDIYPTLCGLAGIPAPKHCVGRDHSAVMRGERFKEAEMVFLMNQVEGDAGGSDEVLGEIAGPQQSNRPPAGGKPEGRGGHQEWVNLPSYRGVRTKTHTYAVALSGRWLLYDNDADPYQLKNLMHDPAQKPLMDKLDAAIEEWIKRSGDKFPYRDSLKSVSSFPS